MKAEKPQRKVIGVPGLYLVPAFFAFLFVLFVKHFWPEVIPYDTYEFWQTRQGNWLTWLRAGVPIFIWDVCVVFFVRLITRNHPYENKYAGTFFAADTLKSLFAGIFEEITFRWLLVLSGIVAVKIANFFFFGWLGFGIPQWFQLHISGPIFNWLELYPKMPDNQVFP